MEGKFQVNDLKREMLVYELRVRGMPAGEAKTVDELRRTLRQVLSLEANGHILANVPYPFDFAAEFDYVTTTRQTLQESIHDLTGDDEPPYVDRIRSRILHLFGRWQRFPVSSLNDEKLALHANVMENLLSTMDQFENVVSSAPAQDSSAPPLADLDCDSDSDSSKLHKSAVRPRLAQPSAGAGCCKLRVEKWNLKFTGDNKHMSVHNFLDRVAELQLARSVSDQELFVSAIDLFSGKALMWYRTNRSRVDSWASLSDLLIKHFEPPDYRARLFRELLDRTQDTSEGIVDYLSSMKALFQRYGTLPEETQLDMVVRNLAPFYSTQLPIVRSFAELEDECLRVEAKKFRADQYVPPTRRRHTLVEPDFAFVSAPSTHAFAAKLPDSSETLLQVWYARRDNNKLPKLPCIGKRTPEEPIGRLAASPFEFTPTPSENDSHFFTGRAALDYILAHANGDERPYLRISVLGCPMLGLLDSGASRTIVGRSGHDVLVKLGLKLVSQPTVCTVANGQRCSSAGYFCVPMSLRDKTHCVEVVYLPELSHSLILGVDFWKAVGIIPDLNRDVWHFAGNPTPEISCNLIDSQLLSGKEKSLLHELVREKMVAMGSDLGRCTVSQHSIEIMPGVKPIKQRYYPVSPFKQKLIDAEIDEMLKLGVIEPSKSPWSSPVCLVRKKDDSYRFCIDFRKLNSVTRKDSYPIPYISAILDRLRNARYISSLDIKSAFWQVPLERSSRELTAFTVPGRNLYHFKRMPFGLTNAPATWQRLIDRVLGVDLENHVVVYLDDIVIISRTFEEHLKVLALVFDRLKDAGLVVREDKCHFCKPEMKYLGYLVDAHGLRPDPEKVQAIVNITPPRNVTEIRRFIGTASWYRRFVPNFSSVLAPLTNLIKKKVTWRWSEDCQRAFNSIKDSLISAPILTCPDFERKFVLQTDASHFGLGAVLTQTFDDGEKVISYLSRSLTHQEMKLTVTEKECLAVIWSVEKLRHYLEGVPFEVITDHHSLLWLHNLKDPQGRLA
uniref:RNA-directed DNA polymerase n=1 Tax=Dendroctonus ponderosae TaxID=77166 RepID=A0AAR5QHS1_DENPD